MAVPAAAARLERGGLRDGALWAAVAAYAVIFFALGYIRYAAHRNFVDLGIFTQTAASAFGCFCNPIEGSHWAFHFSPILYVVGAVVHLWHSALALVAVQAIAGALTAPPIYGIVRRYADRKTALLAAFVVLLYPPLAGVVFNDFHENGLAPAAIAWLLWAFDGGYVAATLVFAALALAIKEDQAHFFGGERCDRRVRLSQGPNASRAGRHGRRRIISDLRSLLIDLSSRTPTRARIGRRCVSLAGATVYLMAIWRPPSPARCSNAPAICC